jgi:hypothetical protein
MLKEIRKCIEENELGAFKAGRETNPLVDQSIGSPVDRREENAHRKKDKREAKITTGADAASYSIFYLTLSGNMDHSSLTEGKAGLHSDTP